MFVSFVIADRILGTYFSNTRPARGTAGELLPRRECAASVRTPTAGNETLPGTGI
jgi:hypothetical protein